MYMAVRMTVIVPQAVVTDNRLGVNSYHAISRLYQATLMSCGTAKHEPRNILHKAKIDLVKIKQNILLDTNMCTKFDYLIVLKRVL